MNAPTYSFLAPLVLASLLAASGACATPIMDPLASVSGSANDSVGSAGFVVDSPPAVLPISGDAVVDDATAFAGVEFDFGLTTSISLEGLGDALANAEFTGTITHPGDVGSAPLNYLLTLDFEHEAAVAGPVDFLSELIVQISTSLGAVVDETLALGPTGLRGQLQRTFLLEAGDDAELIVLLSSEGLGNADAAFAESLSTASFNLQSVAEPATGPLLGFGIIVLAVRRRLSQG